MFLRLQKTVFGAFFPSCCLICRAPVLENGALCPDCFSKLDFMAGEVCARCGVPLKEAEGGQNRLCAACAKHAPAFNGVASAVVYDDFSRSFVFALKYGRRFDVVPFMGAAMMRAGKEFLADADVLMPVPLHRFRLFFRQFNQAGLLAREISKACGKPVDLFSLKRVRPTAKQGHKGVADRAKNVADAFAVSGEKIRGKKIALIDDVFTTGATAAACARVLKAAGAADVSVVTFARVVED